MTRLLTLLNPGRMGLLSCLAGALACESPAPPNTPAPVAPVVASAPPPTPPAPTPVVHVDVDTLPAEEDFEEEAELTITPSNLEKQLADLEQEILPE